MFVTNSVPYIPHACMLAMIVRQNQWICSETYARVKEWISYPKHGNKNMESLGRSTRDAPPTDFVLKIESFSTLSSSSLERYESPAFEAAGAKWKLVIYPNGNKARSGKDHISLYLVLADKNFLSLHKEILVTFRLFVFNHMRNKYLTGEQAIQFNEVKYEYGFDQFLPLRVFMDATNGYLIKDTCLFGAEVLLTQHTNNLKLKCLSMVRVKFDPFRYIWKIKEFSNLEDKEYVSEKFTAWGYDWKLQFYPKGDRTGKGNFLSLFLVLVDSGIDNLQAEKQVIVEYKLRLVDQLNKNHFERGSTKSFCSSQSWGWLHFFCLIQFRNKSNGYLVSDSLTLEADISVLGSAKNWT